MLTTLEDLEQSAVDEGIILLSAPLPVKGLFYATSNFESITLASSLKSEKERLCTLAHELGHHFFRPPDLFNAPSGIQQKFEYLAMRWAIRTLLPPDSVIQAMMAGIQAPYDLAEHFGVTPDFVEKAFAFHEQYFGPMDFSKLGEIHIEEVV